jgi:quercetin dioxygenase-like cupin family protein
VPKICSRHIEETVVKQSTLTWGGLLAVVFSLATPFLPDVIAQIAPPSESKGVAAKLIGALPLAPEISGIDNRQLRMRVVTLAPGGVFAVHSHADRPSVEYVLKGQATEYIGDTSRSYAEGDSVLAGKNTVHWWRNDSTEPAIFVAVDIFNPPK